MISPGERFGGLKPRLAKESKDTDFCEKLRKRHREGKSLHDWIIDQGKVDWSDDKHAAAEDHIQRCLGKGYKKYRSDASKDEGKKSKKSSIDFRRIARLVNE